MQKSVQWAVDLWIGCIGIFKSYIFIILFTAKRRSLMNIIIPPLNVATSTNLLYMTCRGY